MNSPPAVESGATLDRPVGHRPHNQHDSFRIAQPSISGECGIISQMTSCVGTALLLLGTLAVGGRSLQDARVTAPDWKVTSVERSGYAGRWSPTVAHTLRIDQPPSI